MPVRDPVLTPELIRILRIFIFSSLALVLALSLFNSYRADNTGEDKTFRVIDANRLYFLNVRAIHYDREIRRDAGMTVFRHGKRVELEKMVSLNPIILLNPIKEEAYVYLELKNASFPIEIVAKSSRDLKSFNFSNGNNQDHLNFLKTLQPYIEKDYQLEVVLEGKSMPLWSGEKEKEAVKTVLEDYFRLLNHTN
jgi:hypothetical protein